MSKFLSIFIQKTSVSLGTTHVLLAMSKRSSFHKTPKFKPEVKVVNSKSKSMMYLSVRQEKVEVLTEPIISGADTKLYK